MAVKHTEEIEKEILRRVALGEQLNKICKEYGMPSAAAVRGWVTYNKYDFQDKYYVARDMGLEALAEECLQIADDGAIGKATARDRLRIETRKWFIERSMMRGAYVKDVTRRETGEDAPTIEGMSEQDIAAKIEEIRQKGIERMQARIKAEEAKRNGTSASDLV